LQYDCYHGQMSVIMAILLCGHMSKIRVKKFREKVAVITDKWLWTMEKFVRTPEVIQRINFQCSWSYLLWSVVIKSCIWSDQNFPVTKSLKNWFQIQYNMHNMISVNVIVWLKETERQRDREIERDRER
jgi:hypothetical protein